jgi:hypothetical protein
VSHGWRLTFEATALAAVVVEREEQSEQSGYIKCMGEMPATAIAQILLVRYGPFPSAERPKPPTQDAMDFQSVIILIAVFVAFGWVAYASARGNREPQKRPQGKSFWQRFYKRPPRSLNGQKRHLPGKPGRNRHI